MKNKLLTIGLIALMAIGLNILTPDKPEAALKPAPSVSLANATTGDFTWSAVDGAYQYLIKIDGKEVMRTPGTSGGANLLNELNTSAGNKSLTVTALDSSGTEISNPGALTVEVLRLTVDLDTTNLKSVSVAGHEVTSSTNLYFIKDAVVGLEASPKNSSTAFLKWEEK